MSDRFREGDFYRTDDRTGRKVRASDTRKEWTGLIVDKDVWDPRHPQDFVRGLYDRQTVPNPRPVPTPVYIGPRTTTIATAAVAGDTTLTVVSTANMAAADSVTIMLDNNEAFRTTISSIPSGTSMVIATKLPWAAAVDNLIVDSTASVAATLP